jgi:molybdate transport system substrate-binding protein
MRYAVRPLAAVAATMLALTLAGCGSGDESPRGGGASPNSSSSGSGELKGDLTVFAAASLKKTFTQIGTQFEKDHPGVQLSYNFAGSSDLVAQIQQGAPADVFASADEKNMTKATDDSLTAGDPVKFASNTLEIAVPPSNPAKIASLQDLAKPGVKVVVCAPEVPCGSATTKVESAAKLDLRPVSEEQNVTDVLGKVIAGEADAGLVYVTDVKGASDKVEGIEFPESSAAVNVYPIATLKEARNKALADAFVEAVTSEAGQSVLAAAGFKQP